MLSSPSSSKFNKDYYDAIWGTVHRHDYCNDLADRLISKFGKVRILDIGTGCGYLVRCLREKGADAWGIEISDYALANSCDADHVRRGDIRNIPFAAASFDVVHSQGVWGYFPEEDIKTAWRECQRVGKAQEHNIDYLDDDVTHGYAVVRDEAWWKNRFWPKILVACPNHECKEYSFERWIARAKSLTYPNYDVLVVDNSPTLDFMKRWEGEVPMVHIETGDDWPPTRRINRSMEEIRRKFLQGDYDRFFCLESDVIPPPDVIETMLRWGKDSDWISHAYPMRGANVNVDFQQGIGCSMFTRNLIERFAFADIDDGYYSDAGLWEKVRKAYLPTMELWGYMKIEHLAQ